MTKPSRSELNFTPSSTEFGSLTEGLPGRVVLDHAPQGAAVHGWVAVVNDHVKSAASALPAKSLIRGSVVPPLTVTVY